MSLILGAVFPVFALLLLGYWAHRSQFLNAAFWTQAEKATYYILFPCLLSSQLAQAQLAWQNMLPLMAGACLVPIFAALISLPFKGLLRLEAADFTSFFQAAVRFNTYIGLALAAVLPKPAMTYAAVVFAVMIPVINVLCILVFAVFVQRVIHPLAIARSLAKNPLIMGCTIGIVLNLLPWKLPAPLLDLLAKLGAMGLPLGLLAVGAGLQFGGLQQTGKAFAFSSVLKLMLVPMLASGWAYVLGLDAIASSVLILFAALPTASSSYILARQLGGNAPMMAAMITGQTLLSLLSLPLILAWVS